MEIWSSYYHTEKTEGCLKFFHSVETSKIGIKNTETGFSVLPFFDHIITVGDYILVEANEHWGILDKNLHEILTPIFDKLYPVKQIDRESYVSSSLATNTPPDSLNGKDCPTHFLVQEHIGEMEEIISRVVFEDEENIPKDTIYQVCEKPEFEPTAQYIAVVNNKYYFLKIDDNSYSEFREFSKSIYQIFHYQDDVFFCIDINGYYGYGTFENGRIKLSTITIEQVGRNEYVHIKFVPEIVFHKENFVEFRLPKLTEHHEYASWNSCELPTSNKWALCKFVSKEGEDHSFFRHSDFYFLTPFALAVSLQQTTNPFLFICAMEGKKFFVEYIDNTGISTENIKTKQDCNELFNKYKKTKSIIAWIELKTTLFSGKLHASFTDYKEIDCRKDGMFNIYTADGCGLADDKQKVLVQAIYDNPVERYEPYMIVAKDGNKGLIGADGKELIPCKYEYIQVGSDEISVWKQGSEYNETTGECDEWDFCDDSIEFNSSNEDIGTDSLLLIGINLIGQDDEIKTAKCDIYLADGDLQFSCDILPYVGLQYLKQFDAVVMYGEKKHDENNVSFYRYLRYFLKSINDFTPHYNQAIFIDEFHYMVYDNGRVGVIKICSDAIDKLQWVIPCDYDFMSLPANGVLYAVYWDCKSVRLDLFDLEDGCRKFSSIETGKNWGVTNRLACMEELYPGLSINDDVISNQAKRLIGKDEINNLKFFPFQAENVFYGYDGYHDDGYSIEDSLRDAFDDEPEAMWGIMD